MDLNKITEWWDGLDERIQMGFMVIFIIGGGFLLKSLG